MGGAVVGAVISAVAGAATADRASRKQEQMQRDAQAKADEAERKAQDEANRILADTRPEGETAEGIEFGSITEEEGAFSDFMQGSISTPSTSGLKATGRAGLGFAL